MRNPSRSQEQQDAGGTAGRIEAGHEGLHHPGDLVDGLVLTNDPFTQAAFEVYSVWATQGGIKFHPMDSTHGVPYCLLILVLLRVAAHVPYERFLLVNVNIYPDVGTRSVGAKLVA